MLFDVIRYVIFTWCLILIVRNFLVYSYGMRYIDYVTEESLAAIREGRSWKHLFPTIDKLAKSNLHIKMVFDLTKWRYSDFFKELTPPGKE